MNAPARKPKINKFNTEEWLLLTPAVTAMDAISLGEYKDMRLLEVMDYDYCASRLF